MREEYFWGLQRAMTGAWRKAALKAQGIFGYFDSVRTSCGGGGRQAGPGCVSESGRRSEGRTVGVSGVRKMYRTEYVPVRMQGWKYVLWTTSFQDATRREKRHLADYFIHDFYEIRDNTYERCRQNWEIDFCRCADRIWKSGGWDQVDFVYVIGRTPYVDHPSFGHAIISRLLESKGYRVGDHFTAGL